MKKQLYITTTILLIISIQMSAQTKFEPSLYSSFGYENNIFRAPDILELSDGTRLNENDLILSDKYLDLGYEIFLKHKIKKRHIFRLNHDIWNRRYSNNTALNQFKVNARFNYEYKISRDIQVGIKYRFDRNNKIGTSVLGDELTQLFSYKKNNAEVYYKQDILKNTELDISGLYGIKAYDSSAGVIPLNYNKLELYFGLGQKMNLKKTKIKMNLGFSYSQKTFSDVIASDINGSELLDYPLRQWNYYNARFSVKATLSGAFELKPFVAYKIRDDIFQDYYSYNSVNYGIRLSYKSDKFNFALTPEYQNLNYIVKIAPDPDLADDPGLVYNTLNVKFKTSYEILKGVALTAEFRKRNRDTNTLDFGWKTRRSYNYYELMGGISINPKAFIK